MVALASTILFGVIAVSLGLAQVPSNSFAGLLVFIAILQVTAAGLLIWSIGLLSRHDQEAYIASLACFFGLMATRSNVEWPTTGAYTGLAQFTLGVMLGIVQIRILQSVIGRVEDTLTTGDV